MIIDFDHNPNLTGDQKLQSLKESVQMALNEAETKASVKPKYVASEISGLMDFFYPVGSYYETSDTSFDPNKAWGGVWSLETAGQVHVSAGTGYAVSGALTNTSDGGNKDAIIPYHTHGTNITQPKFTLPNHVHIPNSTYTDMAFASIRPIANRSGTWNIPYNSSSNARYTFASNNTSSDLNINRTTGYNSTTPECTPTQSVAVTVNAPSGTSSGNTTNANMQPYVVVNRWHRTA